MFIVTIVEDKPNEDLIILNKLFNKRKDAIKDLSDEFLKYEGIYANDVEDENGNFNCSGCFYKDREEIKYVHPYDERVTDGWIDNEKCCITLQLREIESN